MDPNESKKSKLNKQSQKENRFDVDTELELKHNNIDFNKNLVEEGLISLSSKNNRFTWDENEKENYFIFLRNQVEDVSAKVVQIDNEVRNQASSEYTQQDINPYRVQNQQGKRFCICKYNNYNQAGLWDDEQRMPILYKTFNDSNYESFHFGFWLKKADFVDLKCLNKLTGDQLKLRGQSTNIYKNKIKISVVIGDTQHDIKILSIDEKSKNVEVTDQIHQVNTNGKIELKQAADVEESWKFMDVDKLNQRIYY